MILVLLGTYNLSFARPLIQIDQFIEAEAFDEEVIVQSGYTQFKSKRLQVVPFFEPAALQSLYTKARLVITHGGTGSILQGVRQGKKVVAIARLAKYGEHVDDHQLEILKEFARCHYILVWNEGERFKAILEKAENFSPATYVPNNQKLVGFLLDYIEKTLTRILKIKYQSTILKQKYA